VQLKVWQKYVTEAGRNKDRGGTLKVITKGGGQQGLGKWEKAILTKAKIEQNQRTRDLPKKEGHCTVSD